MQDFVYTFSRCQFRTDPGAKTGYQAGFPSINIPQSGTRKEEKLYPKEQVEKLYLMRRALSSLSPEAAMELLLQKVREFPSNAQFLSSLQLK